MMAVELYIYYITTQASSVADPGFLSGGGRLGGGGQPPMRVLFGGNICENVKYWVPLDQPMIFTHVSESTYSQLPTEKGPFVGGCYDKHNNEN